MWMRGEAKRPVDGSA